MENSQVTFAVRASVEGGMVGTPILVASIVRTGDAHQLLLLAGYPGRLYEESRKTLPPGMLKASQVELWCEEVASVLYSQLAGIFGLQGELEIAPEYGP